MKTFRADLHIHTVLSPCTEIADMNPGAIVTKALSRKLDIIAICDHNSAANAGAVIRAAEKHSLVVIPGMEITTREEVHIVGLFPLLEEVLKMQEVIYGSLSNTEDEDIVSYQIETDEENYVLDFNRKLLMGATGLSVEKVVEYIHEFKGLAVAAHVDREANSIIGQLGFIPPDLKLDALEVSSRTPLKNAWKSIPMMEENAFPVITSSDAHFLEDIGKVSTIFTLEEPTFAEIAKAFSGEYGRIISH